MKDVAATVKRIDDEIVGHHQAIARHQVEVMRLQDTRKIFMGLAEDDENAREAGRREERQALLGAHARPVIIVRKAGGGDEEGTASKAAKNGTAMHAKTEPATKRGPKNRNGGWKKGQPSVSGEYREKILQAVDSTTPMSSREIGDYLGLPPNEEARKGMSNALYQLKVKGLLKRLPDARYIKPAAVPQ